MTGNELVLAGNATTTALELPADMTFDEWQEVGRKLGMVASGCQFWIGDWIRYGEDQAGWGEKYSQALEATGLELPTLNNYVHVSKAIPPEERNPDLPWSHHRATTGLSKADRKVVLDLAAENEWKKAQLEREVKVIQGREVEEPEECPTCHRALPRGTLPPGGNK